MSSNIPNIPSLFEGAGHAKLYAKYRPSYPKELYEKIQKYCQQSVANVLDLAIDVGCGNGQSTFPLVNMCKHVIGVDISREQISEAKRAVSNADFRVGRAEDMGFLGDGTADLMTVGTAIHWLYTPSLWREATRVLCPGGVLAVYSYRVHAIHNKEAHHLIWEDFYNNTLKDVWTEHRIHLDNGLALIELPFEDSIREEPLLIETEADIDDYIGFITTWSAWQLFEKRYPESTVLMDLRQKLQTLYTDDVWGDVRPITFTSPVYLLLGRNPLDQVS